MKNRKFMVAVILAANAGFCQHVSIRWQCHRVDAQFCHRTNRLDD